MIYIPNVWPKPCPKGLFLWVWREYTSRQFISYSIAGSIQESNFKLSSEYQGKGGKMGKN